MKYAIFQTPETEVYYAIPYDFKRVCEQSRAGHRLVDLRTASSEVEAEGAYRVAQLNRNIRLTLMTDPKVVAFARFVIAEAER